MSVIERGAAIDSIHLEPRAFESIREYKSLYTPATSPISSSYVFYDIFMRNKEL
jgi:hypothetical protein